MNEQQNNVVKFKINCCAIIVGHLKREKSSIVLKQIEVNVFKNYLINN